MSTAVTVRGLTVRSGTGQALLDGVDLVIAPGEQVLLVGPSGSGKSTLLRTIAGLGAGPGAEARGTVEVGGRTVLGRDDRDAPLPLGWLPQDPAAAVCLPVVGDDVAFGCENRALPVGEVESAVTSALAAVDGARWRDRDSGTLSAGQAQRVGLAAAIAPRPGLLLLDEPTSMLDPVALRRVRHAVGMTAAGIAPPAVLLVEHRLDEWADGGSLPSRVVVMQGGRVVADGAAARVWRDHAGRLAALGCHLPWPVERSLRGGAQVAARHASRSPRAGGEVLLSTRALAVGHESPVLTGVDLQVRAGEVVALLGANGSGKSTLLAALAGVRRPLAGAVGRPGGRPALVFQDPTTQFLAPTVAQEIAFDGATPQRVREVLDELGLADHAGMSVHRLSGGERRRLSFATVLAGTRRVVLADEPTFGLDRHGVEWTRRTLRAAADDGRGVLVASHDLRFVLEVADRVHLLADGTLLGGGPAAQVLGSGLCEASGVPVPAAARELLGSAA